MTALSERALPRRWVLSAGVGSLAFALPKAQGSVRTIRQRGMSGGGLVQLDGDEAPRLANFGLFASAVQLPDGTNLVLGTIQWIEAGTDLELQSLEVTQCQPIANRSDGAEVRGRMQVNGDGDYPFVIRAIDGGRPGSALDRMEVEVNTPLAQEGAEPATGDEDFTYVANGNLVGGDFQWIIADIDLSA